MMNFNFRALVVDALEEMDVKPTTARVSVMLKLIHDVLTLISRVPTRISKAPTRRKDK